LVPFSRRHFLSLSLGTGLLASLGIACQRPARDVLDQPGQQQTLAAYLDTLIPADETPSATQLGVSEKILSRAATDSDYLRLIKRGCDWLDAQAKQSGAAHFAALSEDQRERVINLAAEGEGGPWIEMFFDQTLADAFSHYYADPRSWRALDYAGPPQPRGFADYTQAPVRKVHGSNRF
jgi:hypothetical protein